MNNIENIYNIIKDFRSEDNDGKGMVDQDRIETWINQFNSTDYIVDFNWTNLKNTTPPRLFITPENTAVVSVGSSPVHMTKFELKNKNLYLSGHSVMMGYFDEKENENIFTDSSLVLQK